MMETIPYQSWVTRTSLVDESVVEFLKAYTHTNLGNFWGIVKYQLFTIDKQ